MPENRRSDNYDSVYDQCTDSEGRFIENHRSYIENHRNLLKLMIQDTRFMLIQTILGHPQQLPSLKEIDFANPSVSKSTIRNHLNKLVENGIVTVEWLDKDERSQDLPYKFYRLSDKGRIILEYHNLLNSELTLKESYSMTNKTPDIIKYENAPRPDVRPFDGGYSPFDGDENEES